jgi:hypothetical protein
VYCSEMQQCVADWNHASKPDKYYSQPVSQMRSLFWQLFRIHSGYKNVAHQSLGLNVCDGTTLVHNLLLALHIRLTV